MYTVTVCDDRPEEARQLTNLAREYFAQKRLEYKISEYLDAQAVVGSLNAGERSDVYVLDIIMPEINGMELAGLIREIDKNCSIIFTTSTEDYAISGYKVGAQDYIVKPVQKDEFFAAFDKIIDRISKIGTLVVKIRNKTGYKELHTDRLVHVESCGHRVTFFLSDGSVETVIESLDRYAPLLTRYRFFLRCHKSCIVNLNFVKELQDNSFLLKNNERIPISRSQLTKCRDYYHDFIFNKMMGY